MSDIKYPALVYNYLEEIGKQWKGQGCATEIEPSDMNFSIHTLKGLKEANYNRPYYVFGNYPFETKNISGFINYLVNVRKEYRYIIAVKGDVYDILDKNHDGPIELCLVNTKYQYLLFGYILKELHRFFIPDYTIIGVFNYYSNPSAMWLMDVCYVDNFIKIAHWPDQCDCAFFKYVKKLNILS